MEANESFTKKSYPIKKAFSMVYDLLFCPEAVDMIIKSSDKNQ
jgi:hypothetical protein